MSTNQKDTIYVDVDDEITAVIDKVKAAEHKIVALVLPKRATVFQSIVNMKLLKRTSDEEEKKVVLITSEQAVIPLAGAVGLYVARTLQSKPTVPPPPTTKGAADEIIDEKAPESVEVDKAKSVGELAGMPPEDETIEVDNRTPEKPSAAKPPKVKAKKIKIPNFNKFRMKLFLAGLALLLLVGGWVLAFVVLPKATVTIRTDATSIAATLTPTVNAAAEEFDEEQAIVPATVKEVKKTESEKAPATGQKDIGNKASGTMTVYNCTDDPVKLPAGTSFTNNGLSFATSEEVTVPASDFFSNGNCKKNRSDEVEVVATAAGDMYNISSGREYSSSFASTITGVGSSMTGGTSQIVKVVSQQDIDSARQRLQEKAAANITEELKTALQTDGLYGIEESMVTGTPEITASPAAGEQANEVTVTSTITYTMVGVKAEHLKKLIENEVKKQIDTSKQVILEDGFDAAILQITDKKSQTEFTLTMRVAALAGPDIDPESLKQEIAGKKRGDAQNIVRNRPGVQDVDIEYSPFWVYSTPKNAGKITIVFEEADEPETNVDESADE